MRLPSDRQRLSVIGRTGSGKTVAAFWHLSHANFHKMPWVIYDFKRDVLLGRLEGLPAVYEIGTDQIPDRPGIYLVHPLPNQDEEVDAQMWGLWARGNVGVFVDEGYMVGGDAFRALLTQGRSKRIPMFILSQRPVWLDRFVFSEADFYQVFALNHYGDRKKVMEYIESADVDEKLPEYHSYYHDVARDETIVVRPVPDGDQLVAVFEQRLEKMTRRPRRLFV